MHLRFLWRTQPERIAGYHINVSTDVLFLEPIESKANVRVTCGSFPVDADHGCIAHLDGCGHLATPTQVDLADQTTGEAVEGVSRGRTVRVSPLPEAPMTDGGQWWQSPASPTPFPLR